MAIVSSRKPRLKAMADRGNKRREGRSSSLLDDPSKLLSTVQIGITAIGVIAGAYGATSLSDNLTPWVASHLPALRPSTPPAIAFGIVIVLHHLPVARAGRADPQAHRAAPRQSRWRR